LRLAHTVEGVETGPALVLSSSLGTTRELWEPQLPALVPHFRVVRYDHPGHGESPPSKQAITVADLALGVVELLDALEIERASFCGISIGAAVGMELALHAPERLDRLVLACTSARFGEPAMWHDRVRTVRAGGTAVIAEGVLRRWFTASFARKHADVVARFRGMLESTSSEGYTACCEALATWDAREAVRRIAAPTLAVAGADDVATPPADAEYLAESIPGARLAVLEHAAHLANVEQPDAFNRVVLEHFAVHVGTEEVA
jgi:3-oxoadipate enol-lactonase